MAQLMTNGIQNHEMITGSGRKKAVTGNSREMNGQVNPEKDDHHLLENGMADLESEMSGIGKDIRIGKNNGKDRLTTEMMMPGIGGVLESHRCQGMTIDMNRTDGEDLHKKTGITQNIEIDDLHHLDTAEKKNMIEREERDQSMGVMNPLESHSLMMSMIGHLHHLMTGGVTCMIEIMTQEILNGETVSDAVHLSCIHGFIMFAHE